MHHNEQDYHNISPRDAIQLQELLRDQVSLRDDFDEIQTVAGVDVSVCRKDATSTAGVVVMSYPDFSMIESAMATEPVEFPYIPGLLAFREVPAIVAAFEMLQSTPDIILVDGHGFAHPRRFGIACHLGIILRIPSIGCAKSKLIGQFDGLAAEAGEVVPLMHDQEQIGVVLRSKLRTNPLFVSPGTRISFQSAASFVMTCIRGYRLPEPLRLAHNLVSAARPR